MTAPAPGDHGGDGRRLAAALGIAPDEVLDLSATLNPCAPDVAALAAAHLEELSRLRGRFDSLWDRLPGTED